MDKTVKWQDSSQVRESHDASDSPTLSDKKRPTPLKRKRSNIFSKIRKSLLGIGSNDRNSVEEEDQRRLNRALSMDAGLQNRISHLSSNIQESTENAQQDIQKTSIKSRMRRSKSLMSAINDFIEPAAISTGIGSIIQSPRVPTSSNDTNDSILEACESFNTPKTVSLINTLETRHLNLTHQIFNCSWLAPTRKSQLFPGTLSLLPKTSIIQFHCQHFNRTIRLKFLFDDILNISRGTWNEKRNQALIIDLIRGKRKSWVFVAWTDDQFQQALDCFVESWRHHCINQIKRSLDRRKAHLNMKYCRIIKEADKANEASKSQVLGLFDNLIDYWKLCDDCHHHDDNQIVLKLKKMKQDYNYNLKHVLYESEVYFITPQVLSSILTEQSTNFMTNFRALHGIVMTNDSGWNSKTESRTFISFVTKEETNKKTFKWIVNQEIKVNEPEIVVFQSILQISDNQIFKINYEIKSNMKDFDKFSLDYSCLIKVTGELESSDSSLNLNSDEICSYFRKNYFPALFNLLEALINESQSEFETETTAASAEESTNNFMLPPHYRFVKESIRTRILEANLYFTTALLPFLYKFLHFKEFKYLRYFFLSLVLLFLFKISLNCILIYIKTVQNRRINVEGQFEGLLKDLTMDAIDTGLSIHSLKLKYHQRLQ
jgi:hypothetical protein